MVKVGGAGLKRCEGSIYWLSAGSMAENPAGGYTGSSRKMKGPPSICPEKSRGARGDLPPTHTSKPFVSYGLTSEHPDYAYCQTGSTSPVGPIGHPPPPDSIMSDIPVLRSRPAVASCGVSGVNGRNIVILINEKDSKIRNVKGGRYPPPPPHVSGGVDPIRKNFRRGVGGSTPPSAITGCSGIRLKDKNCRFNQGFSSRQENLQPPPMLPAAFLRTGSTSRTGQHLWLPFPGW
jgi:hypothetical protein